MRAYRLTIGSLTALLLMLATAPTASAQTSWTAGVGLWADAGSWSGGVPTALLDATVDNGGTARVTTPGQVCSDLFVGGAAGGNVEVDGGELDCDVVNLAVNVGGPGTLSVTNGGQVTTLTVFGGGTGVADVATLTISGAGSRLSTAFNTQLGGGLPGGTFVLNVLDGGELASVPTIFLASLGATSTVNIGDGGAAGVLSGDVSTGAAPGGATLRFNHSNDITYGFNISGTVVFVKEGTGTLRLTGANTYTGATTVSGGTLSGTTDSLQGNMVTNATIEFDQATDGTYAGIISGLGTYVKDGAGIVTFDNPGNFHTGPMNVNGGTLRAGATEVFGNGSAVTVAAGATLDLSSNDQTLGSLAGAGNVTIGIALLTTGGNNASTTHSGTISGATLSKAGTGTMTFAGANTHTTTVVTDGTLLVNGNQPTSAVSLQGGVLGGTGRLGELVSVGGTVAPGVSPGLLTAALVDLSAATTFFVELDGAVAGTGYDQLAVTSGVTLDNATLDGSAAIAHAPGSIFTIIDNQSGAPVTGTFAGLAEGATATIDGQAFVIRYVGGDGNDVTLTAAGATAIAPGTLPAMTAGEPFTVTFTASGGVAPYTFAVTAGTLPDGLTLNATTGVLAGTPTTAGPYSFTITATDSLGGTDLQAYAGDVIAPVPSLPLLGLVALAALLGITGYLRMRATAG